MRDLVLNCINALLLSIVLIPVLQRFAARLGLVDAPNSRKIHAGQVPLVGSAVFVAFAIAALLLKERPEGFAGFLTGLTMLVVLGVFDDLFDIGPVAKLLAQIVCVAVMVLPSQTLIWNIGSILGGDPLRLYYLSAPITIIAIVGLINAVNMMDGIDGLAGCLSLVGLLWLAFAAGTVGLTGELSIALVIGFCLIGFLGFNLRHPWRARAAVFLGDSGSMMLGAVLGFLAIALSQRGGGESLSPIAVLWVCAIPVIDTLSLAVRRLAAGTSPFATDRQHLHHLMLYAGLSVTQVVVALSIIAAGFGAIGVGGWYLGVPDGVLFVGLAAPIGLHTWFVLYGSTHMDATWNALERAKSMFTRPQPLLK